MLLFESYCILLERIEKRGDKWVVLPKTGDKVLGRHDTKEAAVRQLAAIEVSKKKRKTGVRGRSKNKR